MNPRLSVVFIVLGFLFIMLVSAGCSTVRTADTHNTTIAVQSYNTWIARQMHFDRDVRGSIAQLGDDISTYNTEITRDQPDISLLRENLDRDRILLDHWGSGIDNLSAATDQFERDTALLRFDPASAARTTGTLGLMTQYMKIYVVDMRNARQHIIEYINDVEAYIGPDDPDSWNDKYRQDAMQAKELASRNLADGDLALENITVQARQLEQFQ
jgi:hypothetical protein